MLDSPLTSPQTLLNKAQTLNHHLDMLAALRGADLFSHPPDFQHCLVLTAARARAQQIYNELGLHGLAKLDGRALARLAGELDQALVATADRMRGTALEHLAPFLRLAAGHAIAPPILLTPGRPHARPS